jgi:hypothetical protein
VDRLWLLILASMALLWSASARAVTVAVVRSNSPSPVTTETLVRLHGELLAVGLEPEIVDGPAARGLATSDWRAWLEKLAAERGVDAVVAITGDAAPIAAEVWVIDKSTRRFEVSSVLFDPRADRPSERLAIRTIEVLRSKFVEIDLAARERRGESVSKPLDAPTRLMEANDEPVNRAERFGVELGAAAVTSLDGVGPAVSPMLRLDWPVRTWLVMQAALAGLGTRSTVTRTVGNARVAQDYGVVGGRYRFRSGQRLRPFVALSAGFLHTAVEGRTDSPADQGHAVDQWSLLFDGSLGAALPLVDRFYVTLAAHVQMAEPYVAIHFVDTVVATSARPNLLLTLTLGAWL